MGKLDDFERMTAPDRAAWRAWLVEHHESSPGIWLVYFKKASHQPSVTYDEAVEEALHFLAREIPGSEAHLLVYQLFFDLFYNGVSPGAHRAPGETDGELAF